MPLEILGPLVVTGIVVVVLLVRLLVNSPERLLENGKQVQNVFLKDYPLSQFSSPIILSKDQRFAVFELAVPKNHLGFVEVMGCKHLTRVLSADDFAKIEQDDDHSLKIGLNDFTLPFVEIGFVSSNEADLAREMIKKYVNA